MIHLFASQHHLQFDESDFLYPKKGKNKQRRHNARESFRSLVDTLTLSRNCSSINKFSLICEDDLDHFKAHTNRWISNALQRGVSDLDLRITMPLITEPQQLYRCLLPSTVFTSNTLVKLTLGTGLCIGDGPIPKVFLPVLKTLFLYTVWFADKVFSDFMLLGCPVLEELYIYHSYVDHRTWSGPYKLCHLTIKRITIHLDYRIPQRRLLAFNTPNLVYLDYSDKAVWCYYYYANFLDSLLEARLDLVLPQCFPFEHENYSKLISWICNVQTLDLSSTTVELMMYQWSGNGGFPLFKNLIKLSFESKTKKGWKVLWSLIKNSPKLETLILKGFRRIRRSCEVSIIGNVVKVLEICGYKGTSRELIQVKHFLWELEFLQVLKVEVRAKADDNKKLQLTKDILSLLKRSSKCQIQFL